MHFILITAFTVTNMSDFHYFHDYFHETGINMRLRTIPI